MTFTIRGITVKIDQAGVPVQFGATDIRNPIGTATFVYESLLNPGSALVPTEGDTVNIQNTSGLITYFSGQIAQVERGGDPVGRRYLLTCQDNTANFFRLRLPADWVVPANCLDDALAAYKLLATIGGNNAAGDCVWAATAVTPATAFGLGVQIGISLFAKGLGLPGFTIKKGTSVGDALNQISTIAGGSAWFLDYYSAFHWNDQSIPGSWHSFNPSGTRSTWIFSGNSPDSWPVTVNPFASYSEFIDKTQHYQRITIDNGGGLTTTATDWAAVADQNTPVHANQLFREGAPITDSTLTTQAQVDRRTWAEINRGGVRRTVRLTFDQVADIAGAVPRVGQLADIVHPVWGDADVTPVPHISREVPSHSNIRGELTPGSRGRYMIQRITPHVLIAGSASDLIRYDLELGDYQDSLAATLARLI